MTRTLLDLIMYLSLATLIVAGVLILVWIVSGERGERRRDDTRDEGDR